MKLKLKKTVRFGAILSQLIRYWVLLAEGLRAYLGSILDTIFVIGVTSQIARVVIELTLVRISTAFLPALTLDRFELAQKLARAKTGVTTLTRRSAS